MDFPVHLSLGLLQFHPHPLLEAIAFGVSFFLAHNLRRYRGSNDSINPAQRLVLLQHWPDFQQQGFSWEALLRGKTILGAMLGGWVMVELVKELVGTGEVSKSLAQSWERKLGKGPGILGRGPGIYARGLVIFDVILPFV